MKARDVSEIADFLGDELVRRGFVVHRYDAITTSSVYLKLDYGACWSIRVSDHRGYRHLKYRWNIGPWIRERRDDNTASGAYQMHYYPADMAGRLVKSVCDHKRRLVRRIGEAGYMEKARAGMEAMGTARSGFWAHPETFLVGPKEE